MFLLFLCVLVCLWCVLLRLLWRWKTKNHFVYYCCFDPAASIGYGCFAALSVFVFICLFVCFDGWWLLFLLLGWSTEPISVLMRTEILNEKVLFLCLFLL